MTRIPLERIVQLIFVFLICVFSSYSTPVWADEPKAPPSQAKENTTADEEPAEIQPPSVMKFGQKRLRSMPNAVGRDEEGIDCVRRACLNYEVGIKTDDKNPDATPEFIDTLSPALDACIAAHGERASITIAAELKGQDPPANGLKPWPKGKLPVVLTCEALTGKPDVSYYSMASEHVAKSGERRKAAEAERQAAAEKKKTQDLKEKIEREEKEKAEKKDKDAKDAVAKAEANSATGKGKPPTKEPSQKPTRSVEAPVYTSSSPPALSSELAGSKVCGSNSNVRLLSKDTDMLKLLPEHEASLQEIATCFGKDYEVSPVVIAEINPMIATIPYCDTPVKGKSTKREWDPERFSKVLKGERKLNSTDPYNKDFRTACESGGGTYRIALQERQPLLLHSKAFHNAQELKKKEVQPPPSTIGQVVAPGDGSGVVIPPPSTPPTVESGKPGVPPPAHSGTNDAGKDDDDDGTHLNLGNDGQRLLLGPIPEDDTLGSLDPDFSKVKHSFQGEKSYLMLSRSGLRSHFQGEKHP